MNVHTYMYVCTMYIHGVSCVPVVVLVVTFAIFIFVLCTLYICTSTRPDFEDFFLEVSDHIRSVQNYNRFLVYLSIYRPIEI